MNFGHQVLKTLKFWVPSKCPGHTTRSIMLRGNMSPYPTLDLLKTPEEEKVLGVNNIPKWWFIQYEKVENHDAGQQRSSCSYRSRRLWDTSASAHSEWPEVSCFMRSLDPNSVRLIWFSMSWVCAGYSQSSLLSCFVSHLKLIIYTVTLCICAQVCVCSPRCRRMVTDIKFHRDHVPHPTKLTPSSNWA